MQAFKRSMSQLNSAPSSPTLSNSTSPVRADRSLTPEEWDEQIRAFHHKTPNSRRLLDEELPRSPLAAASRQQDLAEPTDASRSFYDSPKSVYSDPPEALQDSSSSLSSQPASTHAGKQAAASVGGEPPVTALDVPSTLSLTAADVQLSETTLKEDLKKVSLVLDLFLNSHIIEAQQTCFEPAKRGSLYMSHGFSCISTIKALLTFEHQDLTHAIECCQSTMHICNLLRKPGGVTAAVGHWMRGVSAEDQFKSMTLVQRHAELVNAECMILKAFAAIMRSGDFCEEVPVHDIFLQLQLKWTSVTFVKEALSLRSAYSTYRSLGRYVQAAEAAGHAVDRDFQSGVQLGLGAVSIVLSLLPAKAISVMSYFGFEGDRQMGVDMLKSPGGWSHQEPVSREHQGLRRPLADMVLLAYVLYVSTLVPVGPIDTRLASRILAFNREIYPKGAFLWMFYGRLKTIETQSDEAVINYWKSINSQKEAVQLHHMCHWDLSIVHLTTGDFKNAQENLEVIFKSSNWSKSVYSYALGASAYDRSCDEGDPTLKEAATTAMQKVPALKQRIAGKSIPMEKYVARKAQRYMQQDNKLLLPALEFTFMVNALPYAPEHVLQHTHLKRVEAAVQQLEDVPEEQRQNWNGNDTWWDDYCLCKLLAGACHKLLAYPPPHVHHESRTETTRVEGLKAKECLQTVLENGRKIKLEHQLVWFAHYEMASLYQSMEQYDEAIKHYNIILNPKRMEVNSTNGKVSLQQAVVIRTSAALDLLEQKRKAKNS